MYKCLKEILSDNIRYFRRTLSLAYINQKKNYKGSALGPVWAFIKPVLYICVFYFAISIGFKSAKDIDGVITPYFIWLTTGMISWFYMRDMILGGASCFRKYRFLVTKMNYPVSTIPTIVSMSNLIIHCILMIGVLLLALAFGCAPTVYWIQLPVYMLLMFIFSTIWAMAAGLFSIVRRDFYNFLKSINMAIFWFSGILFDINGIENDLARTVLKLNPVSFILEGYRNSLCREVWIFDEWKKLVGFFLCSLLLLAVALWLYKKLRKQIPDII